MLLIVIAGNCNFTWMRGIYTFYFNCI